MVEHDVPRKIISFSSLQPGSSFEERSHFGDNAHPIVQSLAPCISLRGYSAGMLWRVANRNGRRSRALLLGCRGPMAWLPDWSMAHVLLLPASTNFMRKSQVTACQPDMNCARCLWMRYFLWPCYIQEHRFDLLLAGSTKPTLIPLLIGGCKARAGKCLVLYSETRAVRPI